MSDFLDTDIRLKKIKAPNLTVSNYGKNIREQFDNIDENFRRVSNRDYVKGTSGANIRITDLSLYDNDEFTVLGNILLNSLAGIEIDWNETLTWTYEDWINNTLNISSKLFPVEYHNEDGYKMVRFYDYLFQNNTITVLYTLKDVEDSTGDTNLDDHNRHYICSPQVFTFLDQRYANVDENGGINEAEFSGREDYSCLLTLKYVDNLPSFTRSNLFPTLYYDGDMFKWKIYGNETGIRAQGPTGKPGSSTSLWLVHVTVNSEVDLGQNNARLAVINDVAEIDEETNTWRWIPISQVREKPKIGDSCIALSLPLDYDVEDSDDTDRVVDAYVSPIISYDEGENLYVILNLNNGINDNIKLNELVNVFKGIGIGGQLGGLFIPYEANQEHPTGAHFLYSTTESDNKHTLNIIPKVNNSGLDFGNPGITGNTFDGDTKLYIKYGDIGIQATESLEISGVVKARVASTEGVYLNASRGQIDLFSHGGPIKLESDNEITLSGSITRSTTPVTATVNDVPGVYLGCPIGTIVMWAGTELPNGWLWCNGAEIPIDTVDTATDDTFDITVNIDFGNIQATGTFHCQAQDDDYIELCKVIKNNYGSSTINGTSGPEYVNLPDLRHKFPYGAEEPEVPDKMGITGGKETVVLSKDNVPGGFFKLVKFDDAVGSDDVGGNFTISPGTTTSSSYSGGNYRWFRAEIKYGNYDTTQENSYVAHPHENMPPYVTVNYIIKYK